MRIIDLNTFPFTAFEETLYRIGTQYPPKERSSLIKTAQFDEPSINVTYDRRHTQLELHCKRFFALRSRRNQSISASSEQMHDEMSARG
jgi:hypothetical protein